ncbi:MAG: ribosome silencing factor [Armatimonadetes bacterium]|nr:ribosome silencing factor [Armatimonadota bacterium]
MLLDSLDIAKLAAGTAEDKLGRDIVILDLTQVSIICDYFVIASAPTRIQTRDIARSIEEKLREREVKGKSVQGYKEGAWILMDYGTVAVHIFLQQERDFYDLEGFWSQAPVLYDSNAVGRSSSAAW